MDQQAATSIATDARSIEMSGVEKIYHIERQSVPALRGVDLQVGRGVIAGLVGKSGAGKSTMLHIIGTLDRPTRGVVRLNGTDVSKMDDYEASSFRNVSVGFVFQMNNLLGEFSALENVMMPGLIAGADRETIATRARSLLKDVGLGERVDHRPGELSGGEQQRVAIARALLMQPPILLADEPTGNLDQKTSHAIQDLLINICNAQNVTMILVTHDMELASRLPHQIVMEDGRIVEGGVVS